MPNIEKLPNQKKKRSKSKKPTNLPTKTKSTKSPSPTYVYYHCCAEETKQGMPPGTKITQLTKHCKNKAPQLMAAIQQVRETEKKKILESWKQIGLSLGKIIDHA